MSVAFSIDRVSSRGGLVRIDGTADFTGSADPGEDITAADIDAELTSIVRLIFHGTATYSFTFEKKGPDWGTIRILDISGSPPGIQKATAVSIAGISFICYGAANFT